MPDIATTDAFVPKTNIPFSVGMPRTGASQSSRLMFSNETCASSVQVIFFALISHQLLHGVYLISVSFDELPIIVSKPQKAHQLCICLPGAFQVKTASTASGAGLTPCLSTRRPRYFIESLRISHFDGLHFRPACFMQVISSSNLSM